MNTIKSYACYAVKLLKNISNRGRAPSAPILDPPLVAHFCPGPYTCMIIYVNMQHILSRMLISLSRMLAYYVACQHQGRSQRGCHGCMCTPLFKTKKKKYFLCRIICFYINNPKSQYVYLSFYLNDYQIIDEVNTI